MPARVAVREGDGEGGDATLFSIHDRFYNGMRQLGKKNQNKTWTGAEAKKKKQKKRRDVHQGGGARGAGCSPGVMPFHRAPTPSSFATVIMVPNMPLYLGLTPAAAALCSCRRTLAVSMGMVHASANDAEKALAARLLTKEFFWDAAGGGDIATVRVDGGLPVFKSGRGGGVWL